MKKKTNDAIKSEINAVYGDQAPWLSTIKYWTAEFKRGRTCIYDVDRPGRPIEATTQEIDDKIHDLVLDEPKTIVRELAGTVHISTERVLNILHEHLGMRKKRLLTIDQKRIRVRMFQDYLAIFNCNSSEFLRRYVTMDEIWIHHYTPEMAQQSKQWVPPGQSAPKRPRTQQWAGKVMASVFWNAHVYSSIIWSRAKPSLASIMQRHWIV